MCAYRSERRDSGEGAVANRALRSVCTGNPLPRMLASGRRLSWITGMETRNSEKASLPARMPQPLRVFVKASLITGIRVPEVFSDKPGRIPSLNSKLSPYLTRDPAGPADVETCRVSCPTLTYLLH